MAYVGLNSAGEESIGLTSTALLDTTDTNWQTPIQILRPTALFQNDPYKPLWVQPSGGGWRAAMRDPFLMEDPEHPGHLLMYYVAGNPDNQTVAPPNAFYRNAVGVVRSQTDPSSPWTDLGYFRVTDFQHSSSGIDESPHVFPDNAHSEPGNLGGALWRLMFTDGPAAADRSIRFSVARASISDTLADNWITPVGKLFQYLNQDQTVYGWEATEYLHASPVDFLGAYDGSGIAITRMYWAGTDFVLGFPDVGVARDRKPVSNVALTLSELVPGSGRVGFCIDVSTATQVKLTAYDVMGRRIRSILDRRLSAGRTMINWDGRDEAGLRLNSGVYFARLSCQRGERVVRIPLVR
jgi:hypothetical protein